MKRSLLIILILVINLTITVKLFAATDGQVGATSTGSANISLTLPKLIRIRNMADVLFPSYSGAGDLTFNKDITVSVNYPTGGYRITTTGSGASSAFTVAAGATTIPYAMLYNDQAGIAGTVAVTAGTPLTGQSGALRPLGTNNLNANYQVKFLETNLQSADAASYSGTLTIIVAPE